MVSSSCCCRCRLLLLPAAANHTRRYVVPRCRPTIINEPQLSTRPSLPAIRTISTANSCLALLSKCTGRLIRGGGDALPFRPVLVQSRASSILFTGLNNDVGLKAKANSGKKKSGDEKRKKKKNTTSNSNWRKKETADVSKVKASGKRRSRSATRKHKNSEISKETKAVVVVGGVVESSSLRVTCVDALATVWTAPSVVAAQHPAVRAILIGETPPRGKPSPRVAINADDWPNGFDDDSGPNGFDDDSEEQGDVERNVVSQTTTVANASAEESSVLEDDKDGTIDVEGGMICSEEEALEVDNIAAANVPLTTTKNQGLAKSSMEDATDENSVENADMGDIVTLVNFNEDKLFVKIDEVETVVDHPDSESVDFEQEDLLVQSDAAVITRVDAKVSSEGHSGYVPIEVSDDEGGEDMTTEEVNDKIGEADGNKETKPERENYTIEESDFDSGASTATKEETADDSSVLSTVNDYNGDISRTLTAASTWGFQEESGTTEKVEWWTSRKEQRNG